MMFNTYTLSAKASYSPGLILMRDIIDHYAASGYPSLDLGIGSDDYKRLFCKDDEPIFDSFIPLSRPRRGRGNGVMSAFNPAQAAGEAQPGAAAVARKRLRRGRLDASGRHPCVIDSCAVRRPRRRSRSMIGPREKPTARSWSTMKRLRASSDIATSGTTTARAFAVSSSAGRSDAAPASSST